MTRKVSTGEGHFHYTTFSCHGRRNLLNDNEAKQIVIHVLSKVVRERGAMLVGFVVMPNHIHLVLGYGGDDSDHDRVVQEIKRQSSILLSGYLRKIEYPFLSELRVSKDGRDVTRICQRRYHDFNLRSDRKLIEKLEYIHQNPVREKIVGRAVDYRWSSCQYYEKGRSVGVTITKCA